MYDSVVVVKKRRMDDRGGYGELKKVPRWVVERRKKKSKARNRMILCRSGKVG